MTLHALGKVYLGQGMFDAADQVLQLAEELGSELSMAVQDGQHSGPGGHYTLDSDYPPLLQDAQGVGVGQQEKGLLEVGCPHRTDGPEDVGGGREAQEDRVGRPVSAPRLGAHLLLGSCQLQSLDDAVRARQRLSPRLPGVRRVAKAVGG